MTGAPLRLAYAGAHPDKVTQLLERFGEAGALVNAIARGSVKVSDAARQAVRVPASTRLSRLKASGIDFVAAGESGFPEHLSALPDTPPGLFVRGKLPMHPGVAVVGTRRCTRYGLRLAAAYGRAIAAAGWPLVSGLARGIDGAAHRGTVEAAGVGIAVLGCGVDVDYPREHATLASGLLTLGGAVVSEYPPGSPPTAWRFPPRNRIISGLSRAVVVVEAGVKGGALITARRALAQGVSVFAVPGDIDRDTSRGCNLLIRDGAHPVLDPGDLIEELSLVMGPAVPAVGAADTPDSPIVQLVRATGEIAIDRVAVELDMPIGLLLADVVRLEAAGALEFDGATIRVNGHRPEGR